eukprot:jgi/Picsp_1/4585/NSC_01955-R1_---NA---
MSNQEEEESMGVQVLGALRLSELESMKAELRLLAQEHSKIKKKIQVIDRRSVGSNGVNPGAKRRRLATSVEQESGLDAGQDAAKKSVVVLVDDTNEEYSKKNRMVKDDGGEMQKRTKRLFGCLLAGTLRKAQKESEELGRTEAAKRRQAALDAAEAKMQASRAEAMEEERQAKEELEQQIEKYEYEMACKRLDIKYANLIFHRLQRNESIKTRTEPEILWKPVKMDDGLEKLRQASMAEIQPLMQALEAEKEALKAVTN